MIRTAELKDCQAIHAISLDFFIDSVEDISRYVKKSFYTENDEYLFLVSSSRFGINGFIYAEQTGQSARLLRIAKNFNYKGVGSELFEATCAKLKQQGVYNLRLECPEHFFHERKSFYERMGMNYIGNNEFELFLR